MKSDSGKIADNPGTTHKNKWWNFTKDIKKQPASYSLVINSLM